MIYNLFLVLLFSGYVYAEEKTITKVTIIESKPKIVYQTRKTPTVVYKTKIIHKHTVVYRTKIVKVKDNEKIKKEEKIKREELDKKLTSILDTKGYMIGAVVGYGPKGIKKIDQEGQTTVDVNKGAIFGGRLQKCINKKLSVGASAMNNSSLMFDVSIGLD